MARSELARTLSQCRGFSFGRGVVSSDLSPWSALSCSRPGNASVGGTLLELAAWGGGDSAGDMASFDMPGLRTRLSQ